MENFNKGPTDVGIYEQIHSRSDIKIPYEKSHINASGEEFDAEIVYAEKFNIICIKIKFPKIASCGYKFTTITY